MTEKLMVVSVAFMIAAGCMWVGDWISRRGDEREQRRRRFVRTVLDD